MTELPLALRADRSDFWTDAWSAYFRWLFKRRFAALWVEGGLPQAGPVLLLGNHTSWWDGPLALLLTRMESPLRGYVGMEARNLRRYRMFRRAGCFGVDRESPPTAWAGLHYAAGLYRDGGAVWVFPQGRMRHLDARPLGFERGIGVIARELGTVRTAPVSFRYEAGGEDRPEAYVAFGEVRETTWHRDWVAEEEARLEAHLDAHRDRRVAGERGRLVLTGSAGVDRTWDGVRGLEAREVR